MGASTRPAQWHHRATAAFAVSLVVPFLFCGRAITATPPLQADIASPVPSSFTAPPETTSISTVAPGHEGLALSARFTQDSTNYAEGIDWKIKSSSGEVLHASTGAIADLDLKPGTYEVLATYGTVTIDEALTLPAQTHIAVNFVLNAGALRVLPRVKGIDTPFIASEVDVFAINGANHGQRVALSRQPGELLKLAAGQYRVISQLAGGNISASTEVEVKPGVMRALDIEHHGGLLHLSLAHENAKAQWSIRDDQGLRIEAPQGAEVNMALKPGHYIAEATLPGETLTKDVLVADGQSTSVVLGN